MRECRAAAATTEAVRQPAAVQDTAATHRPAYDPKITLKGRIISGTNEVPTDSLTLQIVDSATAYENFTSYGVINVTGSCSRCRDSGHRNRTAVEL